MTKEEAYNHIVEHGTKEMQRYFDAMEMNLQAVVPTPEEAAMFVPRCIQHCNVAFEFLVELDLADRFRSYFHKKMGYDMYNFNADYDYGEKTENQD